MAPKSFQKFEKLPLELRLKIWNYSSTPRIIRAKWDNHADNNYVAIIHLSNGPAPKLLRICPESRREALRRFTLVARTLTLRDVGDLPFKDKKAKKIWVDLERDTFYFINFPSTLQFMHWWGKMHDPQIGGAGGLKLEMQIKDEFDEKEKIKRIKARVAKDEQTKDKGVQLEPIAVSGSASKEKPVKMPGVVQMASMSSKVKPEDIRFINSYIRIKAFFQQSDPIPATPLSANHRVIRNIAFPAQVMIRIGEGIQRRDFFYSLLMQSPWLKDIKIVLTNSDQFERTQEQQRFFFEPAKPLKEGTKGNMGGTWGNKKIRDKLQKYYNAPEFWTKPKNILSPTLLGFNSRDQQQIVKQWEQWLARQSEWKGPDFVMVSIGKSNRTQL